MDDDSALADLPTHLSLTTCTVVVETLATSVVVSVSGELDMADADQVGQVLATAVQSGTPIVRLQIADLTFADSSAIKAILTGALGADERGVKFELVNPRGLVQRLLDVTGLTEVLTIVHEPTAP